MYSRNVLWLGIATGFFAGVSIALAMVLIFQPAMVEQAARLDAIASTTTLLAIVSAVLTDHAARRKSVIRP